MPAELRTRLDKLSEHIQPLTVFLWLCLHCMFLRVGIQNYSLCELCIP